MALGKASLFTMAKVLLPICLAGLIIGLLAGFLQVGAIFALDPLKPQLKKLNALEGLKNLFNTKTFIELIKNIAKIIIVFYFAYSTIRGNLYTILQTTTGPIDNQAVQLLSIVNAAHFTGDILFRFVMKVCIAFLAISVIDFMLQRQQFMKQMRMTKDEVKREYKQDEGDPLIKSHRRQLHREFAFSDAKQQVKQSDVVVTNPVHVAVALKYNREEMAAPEISIKGQRAFAEMMVEVAQESGIPIMRNIPLAWALFELEEGQEIPEELFNTVAEILAYIYRMKQLKERGSLKEDQIKYI
jgi:flagellar biosynthetic protein FlhB